MTNLPMKTAPAMAPCVLSRPSWRPRLWVRAGITHGRTALSQGGPGGRREAVAARHHATTDRARVVSRTRLMDGRLVELGLER